MQIWYDLGIYVFWGFFNQILGHVYRNQLYMIVVGRMELFRTVWVQIHILYIYIYRVFCVVFQVAKHPLELSMPVSVAKQVSLQTSSAQWQDPGQGVTRR